jgi:hypothetical protein
MKEKGIEDRRSIPTPSLSAISFSFLYPLMHSSIFYIKTAASAMEAAVSKI